MKPKNLGGVRATTEKEAQRNIRVSQKRTKGSHRVWGWHVRSMQISGCPYHAVKRMHHKKAYYANMLTELEKWELTLAK